MICMVPGVAYSQAGYESLTVLGPGEARKVDKAIARGLTWLAKQQEADGSFPTDDNAEPAITSLCLFAFLACGHLPGEGEHGELLEKGVDFVISCQKGDGSIVQLPPPLEHAAGSPTQTGPYAHAISGLLLSELYGMTSDVRSTRMRTAIEKALSYSRQLQTQPKRNRKDLGGWRYLYPINDMNSDLSVTSWHLMFLRSAKAAGFRVPSEWIDEAFGYVTRCYDEAHQTICYGTHSSERSYNSRTMAGAGIVSLAMAGQHETPMARRTGRWLLSRPFDSKPKHGRKKEHFYYAAFYCSQAMFQLGGEYWRKFYPVTVQTFLANQKRDGQWSDQSEMGRKYGGTLITALAIMTLTPPYQMLPIFQR